MNARTHAILLITILGAACSDEGPPAVASVTVTSPIGIRLGLGRSVQLTAQPRDARNGAHGAPVIWRSSAPAVATVGTNGEASGAATGSATISAEAGGVTGSVTLQVIAADFTGIINTVSDPFSAALWASLTPAVRGRVLGAVGQCGTGIAQGHFSTIEACVAAVRAEAAAATDGTDRALLASGALFADRVERLLIP